jgi:hypothetical protein
MAPCFINKKVLDIITPGYEIAVQPNLLPSLQRRSSTVFDEMTTKRDPPVQARTGRRDWNDLEI